MLHVIHTELEKRPFFSQVSNACEEAFPPVFLHWGWEKSALDLSSIDKHAGILEKLETVLLMAVTAFQFISFSR